MATLQYQVNERKSLNRNKHTGVVFQNGWNFSYPNIIRISKFQFCNLQNYIKCKNWLRIWSTLRIKFSMMMNCLPLDYPLSNLFLISGTHIQTATSVIQAHCHLVYLISVFDFLIFRTESKASVEFEITIIGHLYVIWTYTFSARETAELLLK